MPIPQATQPSAEDIYIWIRRHRGVCSKIARKNDVTAEFVRQIIYGLDGIKSKDRRIERALISAGADFIVQRLEAA